MATSGHRDQKTEHAKRPVLKSTCKEHLRTLLARKSGASLAQLQQRFGWQAHTARAAMSALRRDGCTIELSGSGKEAVYRLVAQQADQ